jgi:hypothetical protein
VADVAVLGDDDPAAAGLEPLRELIVLGVAVPDDEDVVRTRPKPRQASES